MKRRDFIKYLGVGGVISFFPFGRAKGFSEKSPTASLPYLEVEKTALNRPFSLCFDYTGNLLVTDPSLYCVFRLSDSLKVLNSFGIPGSAPGSFNYPKGIASDSENFVYVVDSNNCRVQVFDPTGKIFKVVGSIGGLFATPQGICLGPKERMFVADTRNHRIQIFESFQLVSVIGELGDKDNQFRLPTACQTSPDGEILVLDSKHGLVKIFDKDDAFSRCFGGEGSTHGLLNSPQGMILMSDGSVIVADTGNRRVQKFGYNGKLAKVWEMEASGAPLFQTPTSVGAKRWCSFGGGFG